jgi:hypothetical protein
MVPSTPIPDSFGQGAQPASATSESTSFGGLTGDYEGSVDVKAALVLGPDPTSPRQDMRMTGTVRFKEWPSPGYERRVLPDGRIQIDLEMVSSNLTAEITASGQNVRITEKTGARNMGTLTQVYAGVDFPAAFEMDRLIDVATPLGTLHNEQPILIRGVLDRIPPLASSESFSGMNVFEAVNTPVPLLDENGATAAFFSGDAGSGSNCRVRMVAATKLDQARAEPPTDA